MCLFCFSKSSMENVHKPAVLAASGAPGSGNTWFSKGNLDSELLLKANLDFMDGIMWLGGGGWLAWQRKRWDFLGL